ncbi:hypothetical protein HQQ80_10635 [Microbacteriaceae bacterium VKM Ac-2855]|nr:hypothetical protein [Microbacteriaceae bacterium VKM Ac-2855]
MTTERVGIGSIWLLAVIGAVISVVAAPTGSAQTWLAMTVGGCVIATFLVQLAGGRASGYLFRAMTSLVGAMVVVAVASGVAFLLDR